MGNIKTSRSASRGVGASDGVYSTGRGGKGNIIPGSAHDAEEGELIDEMDRMAFAHYEGM